MNIQNAKTADYIACIPSPKGPFMNVLNQYTDCLPGSSVNMFQEQDRQIYFKGRLQLPTRVLSVNHTHGFLSLTIYGVPWMAILLNLV